MKNNRNQSNLTASIFVRFTCAATLVALLNGLIGCTSNVKVSVAEVRGQLSEHIQSVGLLSGEVVVFNTDGGRLDIPKNLIVGVTKAHRKGGKVTGGDPVQIKISDVKYIKVTKSSPTKTAFLVVAGVTTVYMVVIAISIALSLHEGPYFGL